MAKMVVPGQGWVAKITMEDGEKIEIPVVAWFIDSAGDPSCDMGEPLIPMSDGSLSSANSGVDKVELYHPDYPSTI